jgi:hypothetical protein
MPNIPVPFVIIALLVLTGVFAWLMSMLGSGPFWFGVVIGFVTYRTLKHKKDAGISDIASVIGAVGGATIVKLFPTGSDRFDHYAMGFAVGFFLFLIVLQWLAGGSGTATTATVTATDESRTGTGRRDRITQFLDDDD